MEGIERFVIEAECIRLMSDLNWHVDAFAYDRAVALFTPDCILQRLDVAFEGEAGLRRVFAGRDPNRKTSHLVSNAVVDVIDSDHAEGKALCTIFGHIGPLAPDGSAPLGVPDTIARNDFQFRRTDAGWRIQKVQLSVVFMKSDS